MKCFNRYQSRAMQCSLDLLARLQAGPLSGEALSALTRQWGLDYPDQVVRPLEEAELLRWDGKECRLAPAGSLPRLPLSQWERSYLRTILDLPEARFFLSPETEETLRALCGSTPPQQPVERYAPAGEPLPLQPGPEEVRTLLRAAQLGWLVEYTYRTRTEDTPREARAMPWKLEHSAYDKRWWVIFYQPEEGRTIKARLEHLSQIRLAGPSGVTEEEVERAMESLMEPEPVVLEVTRDRGALERCFLVFENQLFEQTRQTGGDRFRLSFRFYRFDRGEILRRLLYLGPGVRLVSPPDLRRELADLIRRGLEP